MKITKFEEIEAWARARVLTQKVYALSSTGKFAKDWTLRDQMRRSAISVMSNIAEGFDSGFSKEFARFLQMARRSSSELQNQFYIAFDQGYVNKTDFDYYYNETEEIRRMITGFIKYLRGLR